MSSSNKHFNGFTLFLPWFEWNIFDWNFGWVLKVRQNGLSWLVDHVPGDDAQSKSTHGRRLTIRHKVAWVESSTWWPATSWKRWHCRNDIHHCRVHPWVPLLITHLNKISVHQFKFVNDSTPNWLVRIILASIKLKLARIGRPRKQHWINRKEIKPATWQENVLVCVILHRPPYFREKILEMPLDDSVIAAKARKVPRPPIWRPGPHTVLFEWLANNTIFFSFANFFIIRKEAQQGCI